MDGRRGRRAVRGHLHECTAPHKRNIAVQKQFMPMDMFLGGTGERATRIACYSIRPSSLSLPVSCGFVGSTNTVPSSNSSTGMCFCPLICSGPLGRALLGFDVMVVVGHMVPVQHLLGATAITAPFRTVEFDCRCHSSSLSHDACPDTPIMAMHAIRHMSSIVPPRRSNPPSAAFPFIVPAAGPFAATSRCRRSHQRSGPQVRNAPHPRTP